MQLRKIRHGNLLIFLILRSQLVYKTKYKTNGEVNHFKARLGVEGYKQKPCINYFEVFAHVVRLDTICMIIFLTAQNNWKKSSNGCKSVFLNGELEQKVYVEQPQDMW